MKNRKKNYKLTEVIEAEAKVTGVKLEVGKWETNKKGKKSSGQLIIVS